MTLVIAIKCKDGLIFASDGQATSFSSGGPIRQKYKKIYQLGRLLVGASGTIGTIQRCRDCIEEYANTISNEGLNSLITDMLPDGRVQKIPVRDKIRQLIFRINKDELERYKLFFGKEEGAPLADILIALYDNKGETFRIWHVRPDGGEELLDELGYGCTGIGDIFAHAFLKDYYTTDLNVEKGKLVAYRVIKEAIEVGAFGLGEPIDIWVMRKNEQNKQIEIHNVERDEISALHDAYIIWKEMENKIFKEFKPQM
jgi:20S proteasome alpha/beta subunit